MDGPEGETHPEWAARLMARLFGSEWHDLCLLHSRFYAKRLTQPFSRLCVADKLAIALTPSWLYIPMVRLTCEIDNTDRGSEDGLAPESPRRDGRMWTTRATGAGTGEYRTTAGAGCSSTATAGRTPGPRGAWRSGDSQSQLSDRVRSVLWGRWIVSRRRAGGCRNRRRCQPLAASVRDLRPEPRGATGLRGRQPGSTQVDIHCQWHRAQWSTSGGPLGLEPVRESTQTNEHEIVYLRVAPARDQR